MKGKTIEQLNIGDSVSIFKTFTEEDVNEFAHVSGDYNLVHMDELFAATTIFKNRIVHGFLVSSLFSTILGNELPGCGSIYLGQELQFKKPVYLNDTITAKATVKEILKEKNRIILDTIATNQRDEIVVVGLATIMPPTI